MWGGLSKRKVVVKNWRGGSHDSSRARSGLHTSAVASSWKLKLKRSIGGPAYDPALQQSNSYQTTRCDFKYTNIKSIVSFQENGQKTL